MLSFVYEESLSIESALFPCSFYAPELVYKAQELAILTKGKATNVSISETIAGQHICEAYIIQWLIIAVKYTCQFSFILLGNCFVLINK